MTDTWTTVWSDGETKLATANLKLSEKTLKSLWATALVEKPEFTIFGKPARMRRNIGFFSDESVGYKYSGQMAAAQPLSEEMRELLEAVNKLTGCEYNGLLFNLYADGNDYIGAHRDNESELDEHGVVALSLGAGRKFRIRDYKTKKIVKDVVTGDCELMWMQGDRFHKDYTHEVPIEKKVEKPRLSITFRKHSTKAKKT